MASLPTVAELIARIGADLVDDVEDLPRLTAALDDATVLVLAEVRDALAETWRAETPAVIRVIILKAARREYENPRGLNQETYGEHTVGMTDTSGVYLTAREVAQIAKAATGRRGGFDGSIRTPSAYGEAPRD